MKKLTQNRKNAWEKSYSRGENFVFYPHEEVIRFVSKFIRKRTGINKFTDVVRLSNEKRILDLGCGIGRHVKLCHEMGLNTYGVDLCETAIALARSWLGKSGMPDANERLIQGDIRRLPWRKHKFTFALSHGVLDSVPFDIAREACFELSRKMILGGLFYCDLISGDDSLHAREFSGAEVVCTTHEKNTVQLYFNMQLIDKLIKNCFFLKECRLIRSEDILRGGYRARYHLVLCRI